MAHAPHSFRAINVFIQHTRYEIVFVLRWELVAMCSGAQKITRVLWFGEQLPQNMTRVGRDGPKESLVYIAGQVSNGLSITREEPSSAEPLDKSFQPVSVVCGCEAPPGRWHISKVYMAAGTARLSANRKSAYRRKSPTAHDQ